MAITGGYLLLYDWRLYNDLAYPTLLTSTLKMKNIKFLIIGVLFGIVLVKSQVISWFRIQEMFRLQAFHMYGIIGSAIVVGMISVFLIKKLFNYTID